VAPVMPRLQKLAEIALDFETTFKQQLFDFAFHVKLKLL
jgi:hypothetical protein